MSPSQRALCAAALLCTASVAMLSQSPVHAPAQTTISEARPAPDLALALIPAAPEPVAVTFAGAAPGLTYYQSEIDPSHGGHVRGPDGVEISVPPGVIVDALGAPMTERVTLRWALLDEVAHVRAPGGRLTTPVGADEVPLQSYGMVDLRLHVARGVAMLDGAVDLSFPIRPEFADSPGGIGVYHLDPDRGTWDRVDDGRIVGERFVVRATDTGYWNCDEPLSNRGCVLAQFAQPTGTDTRGWLVGIERMYSMVAAVSDGEVCLDGPPGASGKVTVLGPDPHGDSCQTWTTSTVQLSPAGTSCGATRSECTRVAIDVASSTEAGCLPKPVRFAREVPRRPRPKTTSKMQMLLGGAFGTSQ